MKAASILKKLLLSICVLYAMAIVASYITSQYLPLPFDIKMSENLKETNCYHFFYGVKCGHDVIGGEFLQIFYNLWITIWYVPAIAVWSWSVFLFDSDKMGELGRNPVESLVSSTSYAILLTAPLFYLAWTVLVFIGRQFLKWNRSVQ